MKAKRLVLVSLLLVSLLMLAGCKKTWVFNFATTQSLGSGVDYWEANADEGVGYEFLPGGLRLYYTDIASTATFSGDFSLEYDFTLLDADEHQLNWLDLLITDSYAEKGYFSYDTAIGFGLKDPGQSGGYYYFGQNDEWIQEEGLPQKFNLYGANKIKITKTGNKIRIDINSSKLVDFTLFPSAQLPFYRVFAMVDYTGTEDSAGMLLHKVTVKYEDGTLSFNPLDSTP